MKLNKLLPKSLGARKMDDDDHVKSKIIAVSGSIATPTHFSPNSDAKKMFKRAL